MGTDPFFAKYDRHLDFLRKNNRSIKLPQFREIFFLQFRETWRSCAISGDSREFRETWQVCIQLLLTRRVNNSRPAGLTIAECDCNVTIGVQWKSKNAEIMFELQGISRAIIFLMGGGDCSGVSRGFSGCPETHPPTIIFLIRGVTPLLAPTLTSQLHLRRSETPLDTNSGYATGLHTTQYLGQRWPMVRRHMGYIHDGAEIMYPVHEMRMLRWICDVSRKDNYLKAVGVRIRSRGLQPRDEYFIGNMTERRLK